MLSPMTGGEDSEDTGILQGFGEKWNNVSERDIFLMLCLFFFIEIKSVF